MTRPGAPSSRGRHSVPEEGPGRHAAPESAPPDPSPRRRHAAPDLSGSADGSSRRRHAADNDDVLAGPPEGYWGVPAAFQAEGPEALPSRHRAEPSNGYTAEPAQPLNGYHGEPAGPVNGSYGAPFNGYDGESAEPLNGYDGGPAGPVNGHGGELRREEPQPPVDGYHLIEPGAGFPYAAGPVDAANAWPVNGHGLDAAERDAAQWPVNGHSAIPPVNGHGTNGFASNGHAWPLDGTAHPLDGDRPARPEGDLEPSAYGAPVAWPLNGHPPAPADPRNTPPTTDHFPLNGHSPVDGHPGVNGNSPVNGHPADGSAAAGLAGWQREPFRPSYPTALQRETPPGSVLPPSTVLPPAPGPPTMLPAAAPAAPPAAGPPSAMPPPNGLRLGGQPATGLPLAATSASGSIAAPVGPARASGSGSPAAFALDSDDESTQVLRRYVPAAETLGREKTGRPDGAPTRPPHPPRAVVRRRQARRRRLEWPFLIVFALLSAYLIRAYAVQTFYIPSASMHETLIEGDRVLVNKISYRVHDVHRGDVIVFTKPPKLPADEDDLIKRVVGLPGETVQGRGGKIYINGAPLTEPYVAPSCSVNTSDFAPLKVPAGDLWVMGDNRCNSADSRYFGVIDEKTVVGRAFVLVWPVGRFSGL